MNDARIEGLTGHGETLHPLLRLGERIHRHASESTENRPGECGRRSRSRCRSPSAGVSDSYGIGSPGGGALLQFRTRMNGRDQIWGLSDVCERFQSPGRISPRFCASAVRPFRPSVTSEPSILLPCEEVGAVRRPRSVKKSRPLRQHASCTGSLRVISAATFDDRNRRFSCCEALFGSSPCS